MYSDTIGGPEHGSADSQARPDRKKRSRGLRLGVGAFVAPRERSDGANVVQCPLSLTLRELEMLEEAAALLGLNRPQTLRLGLRKVLSYARRSMPKTGGER